MADRIIADRKVVDLAIDLLDAEDRQGIGDESVTAARTALREATRIAAKARMPRLLSPAELCAMQGFGSKDEIVVKTARDEIQARFVEIFDRALIRQWPPEERLARLKREVDHLFTGEAA